MEMELNSLIDKIKQEGVLEAEKCAEGIVKEAREKAKVIVATAERRKDDITRNAGAKAETFRKNSEKALKRAARDVLLTLREDAVAFFDRIVKEKISGELSPDVLKEVIIKVIGNLRKDGIPDIEVLLSEEDKAKLEKTLFSAFGENAGKFLKLTGTKGIEKGFRVGETGRDFYFDFSDEAIAEAFKKYLNPKLVEMLDIDLGLGKGKIDA
ncbi:MAG: hypothetical protein NG740_04205 [Omnitrophica bacterium]|nr:hypothetical protein [Candidatus Omnitrophota bacterium]